MRQHKIEMDCPYCEAYFIIVHDMNNPYKIEYCSFCGEYIGDDNLNIEDIEIDEI